MLSATQCNSAQLGAVFHWDSFSSPPSEAALPLVGEGFIISVGAALAVGAVGEALKPLKLLACLGHLKLTRDELNLVSAVDEGVLDSLPCSLQLLDSLCCGAVVGTVSSDPPVGEAFSGPHEETKVGLGGEAQLLEPLGDGLDGGVGFIGSGLVMGGIEGSGVNVSVIPPHGSFSKGGVMGGSTDVMGHQSSPTIRDGEAGEMPVIAGETMGAREMFGDNRCGGSCGTELGNLCFQLGNGFLICGGSGDDCLSQVLGHFAESLDRSFSAKGMKDVEG